MQGRDETRVMYLVYKAATTDLPRRYFTGSGWHDDPQRAAFIASAELAHRLADVEHQRLDREGHAPQLIQIEAVNL